MFAYYSSAYGNNAKSFGYLLLDTTMTEFTIVLFVRFIQAPEYRAANLFLPARLRAPAEDGRHQANGETLLP